MMMMMMMMKRRRRINVLKYIQMRDILLLPIDKVSLNSFYILFLFLYIYIYFYLFIY